MSADWARVWLGREDVFWSSGNELPLLQPLFSKDSIALCYRYYNLLISNATLRKRKAKDNKTERKSKLFIRAPEQRLTRCFLRRFTNRLNVLSSPHTTRNTASFHAAGMLNCFLGAILQPPPPILSHLKKKTLGYGTLGWSPSSCFENFETNHF